MPTRTGKVCGLADSRVVNLVGHLPLRATSCAERDGAGRGTTGIGSQRKKKPARPRVVGWASELGVLGVCAPCARGFAHQPKSPACRPATVLPVYARLAATMTVPRYLPPCLPVPLANPGQSNPLARYLTKWHPSPSAKTPPTSPSESNLSINQDFNPAPFAAKLNNPRSLRTPLRKSSLTPVIRLFPYCRFYFSFFFILFVRLFAPSRYLQEVSTEKLKA